MRLIVLGRVDGEPTPYDGEYVVSMNVDAHDGRGELTTTREPDEALDFPGLAQALEYWKRQSTVKPLRADGRPNRPLTAYNVTVR